MSEIRHAIEPEEMMAYLDGELPATRAAEAMTHLERCAECQELAADLRRVSQDLAAWQVEPPRAMKAPVAMVEPPRRTLRNTIAMAAAIAAVALLAFVTTRPNPQPMRMVQIARVPMALPPVPQAENAPLAAAPMVEHIASINIATREFDPLRARIDSILARRHGYLADLTLSAPQSAGRSLSAALRVPASELDATLVELRQLGRVESESQKGEDVTRQYADLVARLANARNTEQRLAQILAQRTGKLSDVLEVEREIGRVRGEIEQMEAERRATSDQVTFATVQFEASEDYHAALRLSPVSTWTRLGNAAVEGYRNLAGGLVSIALFVMTYGPSVLFCAAFVFLLGLWLGRRRKKQ